MYINYTKRKEGDKNMQQMYTPDEVAQKLNIKKSTLYDWVHKGIIEYVKVGRLLRFTDKDISKIIVVHPTNSALEWS